MILGVRAHDFGRQDEDTLSKSIKSAGFDTVQLALTKAIAGIESFEQVTPQRLESVRRSFEDHGVDIAVLGCYIEPGLADAEQRRRQVDDFLLGLEHAKALGAPRVGTETTGFPMPMETAYEAQREAVYQRLKDSVLRMVEKAEKLGIEVAIEPVAQHTLNTAELTRRLLDEVQSSQLKIIFDPVNMLTEQNARSQEILYDTFFRLLGKEIVALHVKDIVFENDQKIWRNIGKGIVAFGPLFTWLRTHKPDLPVLREGVEMDSYALDLDAIRKLVL